MDFPEVKKRKRKKLYERSGQLRCSRRDTKNQILVETQQTRYLVAAVHSPWVQPRFYILAPPSTVGEEFQQEKVARKGWPKFFSNSLMLTFAFMVSPPGPVT